MIALRGIVSQNEEKKWIWKGMWTFGRLPDDEQAVLKAKSQPFVYTWEEARQASDVLVPSANLNTPTKIPEQNKKENEAKKAAVGEPTTKEESKVGAVNTTNESKEPEKVPAETSEKKSSAEKDKPGEGANVQPMQVDETSDNQKDEQKEEKTVEETKVDSAEPTIVPSEKKEEPAKKEAVTFATTLPDEPPFTEAATKHPEKCPPGGAWKGYFETAMQNRKDKTLQIPESFSLFLNATPAKDARVLFTKTEGDVKDDAEDNKALLPPGHIHVRGCGSNQYGIWELIGSLNVETGVLECQRMYVRAPKTPGRRGRPRKSEMAKRVSISGDATTTPASTGSRSTRKRQLSWRKRESLHEEDETDVKARKPGTGKRGRPRKNSIDAPASAPGMMFTPTGTILSIPPTSGARRSPVPSPRVPAKSAMTGPKKRAKASPPSTTSSSIKLPSAGDPNEARWRAAHFLYYQRQDPSSDDEAGGSAGTTSYVVYEGEMTQGYCLRNGRGVCLYNNGMLYEGEWKRNKEHGKGTLMTADRKHIIYKGGWERGRMHGMGVYYYTQDDPYAAAKRKDDAGEQLCSRYEGEFRENARHGNGKYFLPNGSVYEGEWREDMMSGRGTFKWPDGSVYVGLWKDGKRNGSGILQASDGFTYDGDWVDNTMQGRGMATYPGGQRYEGVFANGRREGRGSIHFANGAVYEGRFRDDCMEGQGTMKMTANALIPRRNTDSEEEEENGDIDQDWMIPISFQSDMGHIHQKAGFTVEGE